MRGKNMRLIRDAKSVERFHGIAHRFPIGSTAHDDSHERGGIFFLRHLSVHHFPRTARLAKLVVHEVGTPRCGGRADNVAPGRGRRSAPSLPRDFASRKHALLFSMTGRGRAIVLIGFMGSGKSATGRALARKTGWALSDTDEIVTARFGKAIAEIFAEFGEEKFRDAETEALRQLSGVAPSIVVTGGGIVLRPENVDSLRRLGMIAHLEADEEIL